MFWELEHRGKVVPGGKVEKWKDCLDELKRNNSNLEQSARQSVDLIEQDMACERFWNEIGTMGSKRLLSEKESSQRKFSRNASGKKPKVCVYEEPVSAFWGREEELREIGKIFTPVTGNAEKTKIVLLEGFSGIGKTQVARKFIDRNCVNYSMVYSFNGRSQATLDKGYRDLACKLAINVNKTSSAENICKKISEELQRSNYEGWFLLFDNVESHKILKSLKGQIPKFGGCVLITFREEKPGTYCSVSEDHFINIDGFNRNDSVELLKAIIPENKCGEENVLHELAKALKRLPLSLHQVASCIKEEVEMDASGYHHFFTQAFKEKKGKIVLDADSREDYTKKLTVMITFNRNREFIRKSTCPEADEVLNLFAYFDREEISTQWIKLWIEGESSCPSEEVENELEKIVETLTDKYAIVTYDVDRKSISMCQLVQAIVQENLKKDKENRAKFIKKALDLLKKGFDFDNAGSETYKFTNQNFLIHAKSVISHALGYYYLEDPKLEISDLERTILKTSAFLLSRMGLYAYSQGDIFRAEKYYTNVLKIKECFYEDDNQELVALQAALLRIFHFLGRAEKIKKYCEKAKPESTDAQLFLGIAYNQLAMYEKATAHYDKMLKDCKVKEEKITSEHLAMISRIKSAQGRNYSDQGKYTEAKKLMAEALYILHGLHSLDFFYKRESFDLSPTSILQCSKQAFTNLSSEELEITIKRFRCNANNFKYYLSLTEILNNLGVIYSNLGSSEEAIECFEEALKFEVFYDSDYFLMEGITRMNLAEAQRKFGNFEAAYSSAKEAQMLLQEIFGWNYHLRLGQVLNILGNICCDSGNFEKAQEFYEKALETIERCNVQLDAAKAYMGLGNVMRSKNDLKESRTKFERAHEVLGKIYKKQKGWGLTLMSACSVIKIGLKK